MFHLILLGDICLFNKYSIVFDPYLLALFKKTSLANLETAIANDLRSRQIKIGPTLAGHPKVFEKIIPNFTQLNVSLANNHSMDFGEKGLRTTLQLCHKHHVGVVGAGMNENQAKQALILGTNNIKIAVIAVAENQFGRSDFLQSGTTPLDVSIFSQIKKLKQTVDHVIVSIHGSAELSPWPAPEWRQWMLALVDAGASLIHGHHSHVPQAFEKYKQAYIFYGLGNFVVNPEKWMGFPNARWCLVPEITFSKKILTCKIHTAVTEKSRDHVLIRRSTGDEQITQKKYLRIANAPLKQAKLHQGLWQEISVRLFGLWYANHLKVPAWPKKNQPKQVAKKLWIGFKMMFLPAGQNDLLWLYILILNDTHRMAITTALGLFTGKIKDCRSTQTQKWVKTWMPFLA